MYHQPSQQPGPQPFSNMPGPPHHQQTANQQQSHPANDMMSYQFPRPTQLPDELESALAIRGTRDVDHRLMDHMNQQNQHQNQGSGPGINQRVPEHGNYSSNPVMLSSDNQSGHQQEADWTNYQPPNKLFANTSHSTSHQPQQLQGTQQPQSWTAPVTDTPSPQAQHSRGSGNGGGGDGKGLYTPESAGSILASFGLSNEDLEVLSHYPDDQLTPDTLPFILRDIQINKSSSQKNVSSTSSSSFSLPPSHSTQPARSRSPEVPSLFTVTQTTGKVIDYGHASRTKDESSTRETFKRERLSSERTVKMVYSSSSTPKVEAAERRHVRLEPADSNRHGDRDYRRSDRDIHKTKRSPVRDFPPSSKSRHLDRDYRKDAARLRPSSETRGESSPSRRSLSSSSGSKTQSSSKKLPTPTMISDFKAVPPKVYPHTCSLCDTQCDQEKDWIDHINTVNHTAACRDLRNKYPDWKPHIPRGSGQYGSRAVWDPKDCSPSRSISCSLSPSPPSSRRGMGPHRQHGRPYPPHHYPRHPHHTEHGHRLEPRHSGSRSPTHPHRNSSSSREYRPERKAKESSGVSTVFSSRSGLKRPHDDSSKMSTDPSRHPSSNKTVTKTGMKPGTKTIKLGSTKAASSKHPDTSAKPPPAKKKKKVLTPASQSPQSVAARLVYLTGIPVDASEQEVTDLVGSFGKINNVVLMPSSGEEDKKDEGQKASVCMVRAEDAQALAHCTNLSIRNQIITASLAKKIKAEKLTDVNNGKPGPTQDRCAAVDESGNELDRKTSDEKAVVLITGLPESGWTEADIINIIQPFGNPSDIILATEIGKVLVSVPDKETAEEIVKVHNFAPAKINDTEVKMIHLKQRISLNTPVSLYNLLMGSPDPLENPAPVGWSSLLIISNVPETSTGPSEVQKLVRRFGTVIKTLVLNNNLVICEMATPAMAMSVYRRFQKFPCIIQNNPLSFSRKPDPKANTQSKVINAFHDSSKVTCTNGKDNHKAPPEDREELEQKQVKCEAPSEEMDKDTDQKAGEKMEVDEKMDGEDEAREENQNANVNKELKQEELAVEVSDTSAASDTQPGEDLESKILCDEAVIQKAEDNKTISESQAESGTTPAGDEETQPPSTDADATSSDTASPALPKVTREMVHALLEECRTRSARHQNKPTAPLSGEQKEASTEMANREESVETEEEPAKELLKDPTEEELKQQEMERKDKEEKKEKEAREKERKERDRERERRGWEREERMKRDREWEERPWRDRERREEERWEWQRRERERRERRRTYDEGSSGWRSYGRYEMNKRSSWRDEHLMMEKNRKVMEEEEEDVDDFPFNLNDFVTVDEVGDVTDLPQSPPPDVPIETTEGGEDAETPASVEPDSVDTEAIHTETTVSDTPAPVKSEDDGTESVPVTAPTAASESSASSDLTSGLVLTAAPSASPTPPADPSTDQTDLLACLPEPENTLETVNTPTATLDSTPTEEPQPTPAPAASDSPPEAAPADLSTESPETGAVTAEREEKEEEKQENTVTHSQAKAEEMAVVSTEKQEEQEMVQDESDEGKRPPAPETEKHEKSEEDTNAEECVQKKLPTQTPAQYTLPPFDSSNPVGMEFLVPKTGFFCKVCNRFFSGTKEAEINHCKTLKHYENLQKFLESRKAADVTPKRASS